MATDTFGDGEDSGGESFGMNYTDGPDKKHIAFCTKCHKMFGTYYTPKAGDKIYCPKCSKEAQSADSADAYIMKDE